MKLSSNIEAAKKWLLHSGIQNIDKKPEFNGSFNSWFDITTQSYPYIYSEITGYGITTLMYLNKLKNEPLLLERSKLAAGWLLDTALHSSRGIRSRYYYIKDSAPAKYEFEKSVLHSFDNGIILNGLVNLYKETKIQKYLQGSKKIADFLINTMQMNNGLFNAEYNSDTRKLFNSTKKWSIQPGSYHAKIAIGLLNLFTVTNEPSYEKSAWRICEKAVELQEASGRFVTNSKNRSTHLHPHSYSAEGLLVAGLYFKEDKFKRSAAKATKWSLDAQLETGGLPYLYLNNEALPYERNDILAQTLRLGTIMLDMDLLDSEYTSKLELLKNRLCEFQCKTEKQAGGFYYGTDFNHLTGKAKKPEHLNSWCTMFALQSLVFYDDYTSQNELAFDKWLLI